jgi:uncharacterized SAM-dependent methyltransferase
VSTKTPQDVPSPIEFREMTEAREWAATAEQRPGRSEILNRITQEAARLIGRGDRILELGSGPGFLAQRLLRRLPNVHYTATHPVPVGNTSDQAVRGGDDGTRTHDPLLAKQVL